MILYCAVRMIGIVLVLTLLGAVIVLSTTYRWSEGTTVVALLGVCVFTAWWDRAVVRRT